MGTRWLDPERGLADLRLLSKLRLERAGHGVVGESADGQEAVELSRLLLPDVVVLDADLPILSGMAALPQIVAASPSSRVLVFTSLPSRPSWRRRACSQALD